MKEADVDVDGIQQRLGAGRFQIILFLLLGLIYSRGAWHVFGIMFLAGDPGHKCALPHFDHTDEVTPIQPYLPRSQNLSEEAPAISSLVHFKLADHSEENISDNNVSVDAVSTLPTRLDLTTSMLYSFQQGESIVAVKTNWTAETCAVSYINVNGSTVTLQEECPYGWSYGSIYETTILSEWNLVCDSNFLVELSITVFMFGATVGAMVILPMADRFGRKRVMISCLLGQAGVGTAAAFANNYALFTALRCIVGMLNIGANLSAYVLMTESFPAEKRTVMSIAFQSFWAVGVVTVAGFGYLVRNWRHLELLLSLPNLLAFPLFWLIPDSLPWLVSQKRWKEAASALKMIASINGKNTEDLASMLPNSSDVENIVSEAVPLQRRGEVQPDLEDDTSSGNELMVTVRDHSSSENGIVRSTDGIGLHEKKSENLENTTEVDDMSVHTERKTEVGVISQTMNGHGHSVKSHIHGQQNGDNQQSERLDSTKQETSTPSIIFQLFQHRRMRIYSCSMFFLFFINSLSYFGISFSVPVLHGDPFVNLAIMGAVEIPAMVICVIICQRVGRRYPNAVFLLLCGVCNIGALFTPSSIELLKLSFVMVGKFAITAAYSTIYLYSAEIFPTAVRNQGMGIASVFENIGSISAPFIVHAAKSIPELPLALFGGLSIAGAGLTLLLPETHNKPLPQTVQEITAW